MIFGKWYQRQAFNHFISGNFEKAELYFIKLLKAEPGSVGVRHNLALVKLAMNQHQDAVDLLKTELERFGPTYPRYRALGDAYYLWGKAAEAEDMYRKALEEEPSETDKLFLKQRIRICSETGSFADAMEGLRLFGRGNDLQKNRSFDEALRAFSQAVELDPTNFIARNNLGSLYMNFDEAYTEAAAQFEAALQYSDLQLIKNNLQLCREKQNKERKHHAND